MDRIDKFAVITKFLLNVAIRKIKNSQHEMYDRNGGSICEVDSFFFA
jgi:hypothetical protein